MIAPVHRLSKGEIVSLANQRCVHRHTLLEHYQCRQDKEERVGFLDIETSNLDANYGFMLTYCIKEQGGKIHQGMISKDDVKKFPADKTDTRLLEQCIGDMMKFDRIVAHYGRKFDVPFLRTRALICGVKFPPYKSLSMDDTWRWAKDKLKLNSNRLATICETLFGETNKTRIVYRHWVAGSRGDQKSLKEILQHNIFDVIDLERIWLKLRDYVNVNKSSI